MKSRHRGNKVTLSACADKHRAPGLNEVETERLAIAAGYRGVIQHRGRWWIGWIDEIAGVNSQAKTRGELIENLGSALEAALEMR